MPINTNSITLTAASSQYLSHADATAFQITGDITIEFWIKFTTTPANNVEWPLISKYGGSGTNGSYSVKLYNSAGTIKLNLNLSNGSSSEVVGVNWTPSTAIWYHVAVSRVASTATTKFFINGIQQGTSQVGTYTSIYNSNQPFTIGKDADDGSVYADAKFDEIRLSNSARYSGNFTTQTNEYLNDANTNALYHLDNDLIDASSNGNTLTNNNTATFTNDVGFPGISGFLNFF